jgi:hypothetical protein
MTRFLIVNDHPLFRDLRAGRNSEWLFLSRNLVELR